ncbi:hypothetical protein QWJ07_28860 [Frankia sp. RB7]|nr:hypothetical protein [Frankia sp. RB7]
MTDRLYEQAMILNRPPERSFLWIWRQRSGWFAFACWLCRRTASWSSQASVDIGGHLVAVCFLRERVALRTGFKACGLFKQAHGIGR